MKGNGRISSIKVNLREEFVMEKTGAENRRKVKVR